MQQVNRIVVLGLIALIAACGSGPTRRAATTSTGAALPTTAPTSAVVTSAPAPTSSTAPHAPSVTASTTSTPVPTSVPTVDQVRTAAEAFAAYYVECLRKPNECDVAKYTVDASDARAAFTKTIGDLTTSGFFVGAEDPGYTVIESVDQQADFVLVKTCEWSTMVLYGPPATPSGPPLVQNDTHGTTHIERQWVLEGGTWKIRRSDTTGTAVGVNECGPKP